MTFYGYKWKQNILIFTSLIGWIICLISIPIYKFITIYDVKKYITLFSIVCAGIFNGFFFPSIIGIASMIDRKLVT